MTIQENVPLAPLTTLQVGGRARYFAELKREDEVREAAQFAKTRDLPLFVLGGGSNLVVGDSGWAGLVVRIAIGGITSPNTNDARGNAVLFSVGAGVNWDDFVAQAVVQNCAGVECLSGIPGSVGGTPVQNVGAYGQEVSETIESVRAFDLIEHRTVVLSCDDCGFRYRTSIFNSAARGRYVILRVTFRLTPGGAPSLKYVDLQTHFSGAEGPPSLLQAREVVRQIRQSKGMLIVPGDPDALSAGSFFKNPVLSTAAAHDLVSRAASRGLVIPTYPALDNHANVSPPCRSEPSRSPQSSRPD